MQILTKETEKMDRTDANIHITIIRVSSLSLRNIHIASAQNNQAIHIASAQNNQEYCIQGASKVAHV
jgi:hypothetical protein